MGNWTYTWTKFARNSKGRCFSIWLGDGTGNFTEAGGGVWPYGTGYPAIADFNGDGNLDVALSGINFLERILSRYISVTAKATFQVRSAIRWSMRAMP
jgi:hypothetical protein